MGLPKRDSLEIGPHPGLNSSVVGRSLNLFGNLGRSLHLRCWTRNTKLLEYEISVLSRVVLQPWDPKKSKEILLPLNLFQTGWETPSQTSRRTLPPSSAPSSTLPWTEKLPGSGSS